MLIEKRHLFWTFLLCLLGTTDTALPAPSVRVLGGGTTVSATAQNGNNANTTVASGTNVPRQTVLTPSVKKSSVRSVLTGNKKPGAIEANRMPVASVTKISQGYKNNVSVSTTDKKPPVSDSDNPDKIVIYEKYIEEIRADLEKFYTKQEVDDFLAQYYTADQIDELLSQFDGSLDSDTDLYQTVNDHTTQIMNILNQLKDRDTIYDTITKTYKYVALYNDFKPEEVFSDTYNKHKLN